MKKTNTKASSLRSIMVILLLLAIGLSAVGFYYAQVWLNDFAISVGQVVAKSTANSTSSQGISQLQSIMSSKQTVIDKLNVFTVSSHDYQSQALDDLNKYAANNEISISDFNVTSPAAAAINVKNITIKLTNPVQISSLIKFLKSIETNLPKMQITEITIKDNSSKTGTVNVDPLTIEVYTK